MATHITRIESRGDKCVIMHVSGEILMVDAELIERIVVRPIREKEE